MPKTIFHWSDSLRERQGPAFFEVPGQAAPVPAKPQLPSILASPGTCARLEKESEPLSKQIVERGLGFEREKLEGLLSETRAEIERLDARLPRACEKTANGLLKHYARGQYDTPYGAVGIERESQLWRAFPYVLPVSEISAIMARLRPRRLEAFCANILAALDDNGRVHSPVFASALNGAVPAFDGRELAFAHVVRTIKAPALVVHLPDLALRSLAFATGDTTLSEILGAADPWATIWQRVHPEASAPPTDSQRAETRELTLGHIFGSGLGSSNEWFGSLHLPRTMELYEAWFKSLAGWRTWCGEIDAATADVQMRYQSSYSYPNAQRSGEQKRRLLRENTLVTSRAVGLSIAETLENLSTAISPAESRGRGEPRKVDAQAGPQLVAAIGDCYVIECLAETAAELEACVREDLTALFAENFPSFPLLTEIKNL